MRLGGGVPIDWSLVGVLSAIVILSAFVQGTTGFGFGLTAMALLPFIVSPQQANILVTILSVVNSLTITLRMHRHANWRAVAMFLLGAVVGLPIGVYYLRMLSAVVLKRIVGLVVTGAALSVMFSDQVRPRPVRQFWAPVAGTIGGVLSGVASIGGPPVILYTLLCRWDKEEMKATLVTYFTIAGLIKVAILMYSGMFTAKICTWAALTAPIVILGTHVGMHVFRFIPQKTFRRIVCVLLVLIGLGMAF